MTGDFRKRNVALVSLALAAVAHPAFAQPQVDAALHCLDIGAAEAQGVVYGYTGGLGKHFSLQLQKDAPGDSGARKADCSAQDRDATNVACTIQNFFGIAHVKMDGADSYFQIAVRADIRLTAAPGQPVTCILQRAR